MGFMTLEMFDFLLEVEVEREVRFFEGYHDGGLHLSY